MPLKASKGQHLSHALPPLDLPSLLTGGDNDDATCSWSFMILEDLAYSVRVCPNIIKS